MAEPVVGEKRSSRFVDGLVWGSGMIIASLVVGGALKMGWNALFNNNSKNTESDEDGDEDGED